VYVTGAGALAARYVLHAVTMEYPGEAADLASVRQALRNIVAEARRLGLRRLALPALGTGVGGLDKQAVARIYAEELASLDDLEVTVVDRDRTFTDALLAALATRADADAGASR
ncbi:MAG: macro domain-containing protein, partial [Clostridia bacterium]|nr:macro domain-containing protein [Clostridia bacterium]